MSTDFAVLQAAGNEALRAGYLDIFNRWARRLLADRAGNTFVAGSFSDSLNPPVPSTYPPVDIKPGFIPTRPAIRPTPLYIDSSYARVA